MVGLRKRARPTEVFPGASLRKRERERGKGKRKRRGGAGRALLGGGVRDWGLEVLRAAVDRVEVPVLVELEQVLRPPPVNGLRTERDPARTLGGRERTRFVPRGMRESASTRRVRGQLRLSASVRIAENAVARSERLLPIASAPGTYRPTGGTGGCRV